MTVGEDLRAAQREATEREAAEAQAVVARLVAEEAKRVERLRLVGAMYRYFAPLENERLRDGRGLHVVSDDRSVLVSAATPQPAGPRLLALVRIELDDPGYWVSPVTAAPNGWAGRMYRTVDEAKAAAVAYLANF